MAKRQEVVPSICRVFKTVLPIDQMRLQKGVLSAFYEARGVIAFLHQLQSLTKFAIFTEQDKSSAQELILPIFAFLIRMTDSACYITGVGKFVPQARNWKMSLFFSTPRFGQFSFQLLTDTWRIVSMP